MQRIGQQGKVDRLGPAGTHVEQMLARTLQEVLDGLLGNAILEVRVHATKGKLLYCVMACLSEGTVVNSPIVAVKVEDFHSMFSHIVIRGKLGGKCFG
jgi:hypothetical protein